MKLTAIRHTRVDVPSGVCYGQSDVSLASTYTDEMKSIKAQVSGCQFDRVYCSPLTRCRRLAGDLFPRETIRIDERLLELNFGQWEMQAWDAISQTPEAQTWFDDYVEVLPPGGESFRDQINRTSAFLDDLKRQGLNQVAIVSHGGILRSLDCVLNGTKPVEAFQNKVDFGEVIHFSLP